AKQLAAWSATKKALDQRIELEGKDPFIDRVDGTLNGLRDKAFFKDLDYEIVETLKPYALIVQVSGDEASRKKRVERVENAYRPYLEAYDKKVHSWLLPLSPKPPKLDPTFVTWVLLDVADYNRYSVEVE